MVKGSVSDSNERDQRETQGKPFKEGWEQAQGQEVEEVKDIPQRGGMRSGEWKVVQGEGNKDNSRVVRKENWEIV